jgi:hypothetical protein
MDLAAAAVFQCTVEVVVEGSLEMVAVEAKVLMAAVLSLMEVPGESIRYLAMQLMALTAGEAQVGLLEEEVVAIQEVPADTVMNLILEEEVVVLS